jgi:hypothetical protein
MSLFHHDNIVLIVLIWLFQQEREVCDQKVMISSDWRYPDQRIGLAGGTSICPDFAVSAVWAMRRLCWLSR